MTDNNHDEPTKKARFDEEHRSIGGRAATTAALHLLGDLRSPVSSSANFSPVVRLESALSESYVRTRHNNLRCFPRCSPFHMEQRFCGRALEVSLVGVEESIVPSITIFGEFRNKRTPQIQMFNVGNTCTKSKLSELSDRIMFAEYVRCIGGQERYVVHPPRKWHYPGKMKSLDWHVVQLYVVQGDIIRATFVSSAFHVVPIWKSIEGKGVEVAVDAEQPLSQLKQDAPAPVVAQSASDYTEVKSTLTRPSVPLFSRQVSAIVEGANGGQIADGGPSRTNQEEAAKAQLQHHLTAMMSQMHSTSHSGSKDGKFTMNGSTSYTSFGFNQLQAGAPASRMMASTQPFFRPSPTTTPFNSSLHSCSSPVLSLNHEHNQEKESASMLTPEMFQHIHTQLQRHLASTVGNSSSNMNLPVSMPPPLHSNQQYHVNQMLLNHQPLQPNHEHHHRQHHIGPNIYNLGSGFPENRNSF